MCKEMSEQSTDRKNSRLLFFSVFLFWFSVYTYPSFLSTYAVDGLGTTKVMAGMIVGSYGLTQMVLRIPLGIASDLLKKRKLFVMIGFGLSIVASSGLSVVALCAVGESVPEWLAAAALLFRGISGMTAATWVNFTVLYSSSCQGDQVAAAMSRIVVPQCGSQIIAMLLGAQLADRLGELYAFLLAAAAGIAGLIVMSMVRERPPAGAPVTLKSFAAVAKNRQLIIGTLLATIYQLVVWATVQGFVQNWAHDVIGITTAQLGYLSVANLLPNILFSRFSGTLFSKRFGRRAVLTAGFAFIAAACSLYPHTNSLITLLAVQALLGSGVGLIMPLTMAGAIESVPDEKRGAAMGFYQAVYGLGMFIGPVISGAVIERFSEPGGTAVNAVPGYIANFYTAMCAAIAGGVLAFAFTRGKSRKKRS